LTRAVQFAGRSTGQSDNNALIASVPRVAHRGWRPILLIWYSDQLSDVMRLSHALS
jgi:hypothetical protein